MKKNRPLCSVALLGDVGGVEELVGFVAAGLAKVGVVELLDHRVLMGLSDSALFVLLVEGFCAQSLKIHVA